MKKLHKIGIIGTGQLAEYIITGIHKAKAPYTFVVSPRSKAVTINLRDKFKIKVAKDNQDVINECDNILICLPAKDSLKELSKLSFEKNKLWNDLLNTVIIAITVIVVAIPEGLPLSISLAMSFSINRLKKD